MTTHGYATRLAWTGSTGTGYEAYGRTHTVTPEGSQPLSLSADPAFRGDASLPNPEVLLLAAASSCQLLSFLALAARARIDVVSYVDEAVARMSPDEQPMRITRIVLRPQITVRGAGTERVRRLVRLAHEQCYIANSLASPMDIEPVIDRSE